MKFLKNQKENTIVISDTHFPFQIYGYLDFANEVRKKYKCTKVVHIGDFADNHAMSYHDSDPDGWTAGEEHKKMREEAKKFFKVFPKGVACIGNHDALPFRKAYTHGLTKNVVKDYREIFGAPDTWDWAFRWEIDGVQYIHGTGFSGKNAALTAAERHRQSTVIGHVHSYAGIQYSATNRDLIFGMNVGWLGDNEKYAFEYGKVFPNKPIVSVGVVIEGKYPILIPMDLGSRIEPVENDKIEIIKNQTIPKINYSEMTKDELKAQLDMLDISYLVKERKNNLIQKVMEAKDKTDDNKAGKQSWWKKLK